MSYEMKPHPKDAKVIDDLPNIVVDEEGFKVAAFRFYNDAKSFIKTVESTYPCCSYCIEGEA